MSLRRLGPSGGRVVPQPEGILPYREHTAQPRLQLSTLFK